jgi:serine protease Do
MRFFSSCRIILITTLALAPAPLRAEPVPAPPLKTQPETLEDLRALQRQVAAVSKRVSPAVVGLRVGRGLGSGVIVSEDGIVLTAGHVSGDPDKECTVILPDGKLVKGKTLGAFRTIDSGMVKITDPPPTGGKWPFVELGHSAPLRRGQWCVALGHPGGFKPGRTPPLRLGRVLDNRATLIRTDCTLVGGDSGGPLFDLDGKLIAIHSRIGATVSENIHVPIDTYRDTWKRLIAAEAWGEPIGGPRGGKPFLGVDLDNDARVCRVAEVEPDSPAEKAGIKPGDVILSFDGEPVANFEELTLQLVGHKPGDTVNVRVRRGDQTLKLKLQVGRRTP